MTNIYISNSLSDKTLLIEIGQRMARRRLALQYTQAHVAEQAGVAKRTVERIEAGASTQTATLIRILRVLDLLKNLDKLIPETRPSPINLLKHKGKERQRASAPQTSEPPDKSWTWDDEG